MPSLIEPGRRLAALLLLAGVLAGPARAEEAASFVGAASCAPCHAAQTAAWQGSHHAQAMQPASASTVLGDFADSSFRHQGVTTGFRRDGERFLVRTEGADGAPHDYPVAYTFGVYPLQQYLIPFPGGRVQALGIAWDSRPGGQGGQRWFHLYPEQTPKPGERLHWTGRDQTWNYQCAACHSTNLRRNFDLAANSYATAWTDLNVACEACHGPGSAHLAWAARPPGAPEDARKGLLVALRAADRGVWTMNPATGIAQRATLPAPAAVLDACGGCHARRSVLGQGSTAATPLLDAYQPALLEPGLYHADGQIDGEVFELGAFLQSRMQRAGVVCTNCHDPHTAQLRAPGTAVCLQCHQPEKFATTAHHNHPPGSAGADCAACHMPAKTYMGVHVRHDHSFRVPRPDLSVQTGVPNTCTQCHADRTAAWAAQTVAGWYPNGRQTTPHYALALHAGRTGAADSESRLDALTADTAAPGIARASALALLGRLGTRASDAALAAAARDADPLVRAAVPRALSAAPAPAVVQGVVALLGDPVRAVRIAAARALAGLDPRAMTPAQQGALGAATGELIAAELVDADRPEAHLNLGLLAVRRRLPDQAEAAYATALRLDPGFVPALVNLADLDRMRGQDAQGEALLRRALALAPADADVHHALGLLLVRQHRTPEALAELRQASTLAPDNVRYAYVYAVALHTVGGTDQALAVLERAHLQQPADREVLLALVTLARQKGDRELALRHALELAARDPADPQLRQLVRELGGANGSGR